ncbi:Non-classical phosphatidylinositol transfer protein (PITP) [Coemansia sp. RSA 1365]|nr:Non-classical phosphatidylinositol transfer protein (PITP) [Coemansia sp. RSA 1365]
MATMAAETTQPKTGKAQQFSEEMVKLINELRAQLPDIVEDAGKASTKPVNASLWGIRLLPESESESESESETPERDLRLDVILAKFVKARNNDVKLAREMLTNTLKWRAEFGVDGILEESFPEDVFGKVGYLYGHDTAGRPVTYNFYGGLDNKLVFGDLDRFLRWRVQLHERGMQQLDFVDVADMLQVHDYEGVGLLSYDKFARTASRATVQLMTDNYPETLHAKIFANVPGWGETIFNIIGRWLSEETKRKFVVVSKVSAPTILAQRIEVDNLPEKFRNKSELTADTTTAANETTDVNKVADAADDPENVTKAADVVTSDNAAKDKDTDASLLFEPHTAHVDAAEELPKPTDAIDEHKAAAEPRAQNDSDPSTHQKQEPATVTAAPEENLQPDVSSELADKTAGMRLDDRTNSADPSDVPKDHSATVTPTPDLK